MAQAILRGANKEDAARWMRYVGAASRFVSSGKTEIVAHNETRQVAGDLFEKEPNNARFAVIEAVDFKVPGPRSWLIKNVRPANAELAVTYGASTSGKSAVVFDQACAMNRGSTWRGLSTRKSRVIYLCAEGAHDFRYRVEAYAVQFNVPRADLPAVIEDAPDLLLAQDISALIEQIRKTGKCDELIVDTWSQCLNGDENSSKDAGRALRHCKQIHRDTGALVHLVAHTGKDETKGIRGWSGIRAACDAEYEVRCPRGQETRVLEVTKMKGGRSGKEYPFKLRTVVLGKDADGEEYGAVVVDPEIPAAPRHIREHRGVKLFVINSLREARGPIPFLDLVGRAVLKMPQDPNNKRDTRAENARRAISDLVAERALLRSTDEQISLPGVLEVEAV